ncbi:Protein of uncharacterised function (DUF1602) [Mycobacteroides abscessus subsp. abscessus]|nr:Protein of uncharacterised function (DUF1602) [Mycobacteroides abscessus subsp. abscessus]
MGSTALKGSSINRIGGSAANARATPTRCCWPPESCAGYLVANFRSSPTRSSTSSAVFRAARRDSPRSTGTVATLSITRWWGIRPAF